MPLRPVDIKIAMFDYWLLFRFDKRRKEFANLFWKCLRIKLKFYAGLKL
jgi:hypothetical protein